METIHLTLPISTQIPGSAEGSSEEARRVTGEDPSAGGRPSVSGSPPDPEVPEKKPRRRFTAKYKLRVLAEADSCTKSGQLGALLRREGLYSSNLTTWRRQRDEGLLHALSPKKRGRKKKEKNQLAKKVAQLERENRRLHKKLHHADLIIEAQKKMSEILGITRDLAESDESK
jgi:transposase